MQNIAQFLRYISLTFHQLVHYTFHTSLTFYNLHTTWHQPKINATPFHEHRCCTWQGDQPNNIQKTSSGNLRKSKSLGRFSQSCFLHFAGLSNTLNYNWYCEYGKEFPVAVEDGNEVSCTITYTQVGKSTDKVTGQNITVPGGEDNISTT